jgi:hypothetical protein
MVYADFFIKRGDTLPVVSGVAEAGGVPIDLTDATADFHLTEQDGTLVLDQVAAIDIDQVANPGLIVYAWAVGETDDLREDAEYLAEFQVTFLDGAILTVPNDRNLTVRVTGDLG